MSHNNVLPILVLSALMAAPMVSIAEENMLEKTGEYINDASLTAAVKTALMADEGLKSFDISVTTTHQKVQLTGAVANQEIIEQAGKVAKSIKGVKAVENNLVIKK